MANEAVSFTPKERSTTRNTQYRIRRVNSYCEGMQFHADVPADGEMRVNLGPVPAADADRYVTSIALSSGTALDAALVNSEADAPYGRTVSIVASGANTRACTIQGWDYLGQPMTEQLTFNGTTPVASKKAFYFIESVNVASGADTTSITVGTGAGFGVPFYSVDLVRELVDGANVSTGSLTVGSLAAQDATSTDPRGIYTPVSAPDGSKEFVITLIVAAIVGSGVGKFNHPIMTGGLHGTRHYSA